MMKTNKLKTVEFAICVSNEGFAASLEVGRLYQILPDDEAASHDYVRVIDESGEDYGYSNDRFFRLIHQNGVALIKS
jgi:hypothetical protein